MTAYEKQMAESRRLCMLRALTETGGTANDGVLHTVLEAYGHRNRSREVVRADIRFLIENGLAVDEWVRDVQIVTITHRGVDVAEGRVTVEGVKKPRIGV